MNRNQYKYKTKSDDVPNTEFNTTINTSQNIAVIYILSKKEFCYECLSAMVGDSVFPAWSGWWPSSIHSNTASSLDWHSRKEQAFCYIAHRGTHRTSDPPERMV